MKHNNQIPNNHFRKHWQVNVKTWFDQPARKQRRRMARLAKAARISPRPVDGALRPAVRCPTIKYNTKVRLGRGFSLGELKAVGLSRLYAQSIGISVDPRRRSVSDVNKARLEMYKTKIVILKSGSKDQKSMDIDHPQLPKGQLNVLPGKPQMEEPRAITKQELTFSAFEQRQKEAYDRKNAGKLAKKAAEEEREKAEASK